MWEIFLATVISLSVGVREPRNVSNVPFDYELSYKLENNYKDLDFSFKHDYEREDGDYFNDIRAELNYLINNIGALEFPHHGIILKEDYKQITSKDLYQFNSDIRYQWNGLSVGYGFIWDLKDNKNFKWSAGYSKKITLGKWKLETENDIYYTKPLTYQTEAKIIYNITNNIGIGLSGNYIETLSDYDYNAQAVITIKFG
tara:strand:- start:213 stop:812 length:600 start_codon:yes stop_codon:yes gene_type:complete